MTSITDPEINAFLAVGTRTGKLAYAGMDGRPLVTPVWFVVEDGCIVFNTFHKSAKASALALADLWKVLKTMQPLSLIHI